MNPSAVAGDSHCSSARLKKRRSKKGNAAVIKSEVPVVYIPKPWDSVGGAMSMH